MPALTTEMTRLPPDWTRDVATLWRRLEGSADPSFFQSWTWLGCDAAMRFNRPVLLTTREAGEVVGAALFNRSHPFGLWWLHETGRSRDDAVFIEHNGPLVSGSAQERSDRLVSILGQAVRLGRAVHLSGVSDEVLAAAERTGAVVDRLRSEAAPFIDLSRMEDKAGYFDQLSRNTRQQLRRAERHYGCVRVVRADTGAEGLIFFGELVALHTKSWEARGLPGGFQTDAVLRFHRAMIPRGITAGEIDLFRIEGGAGVIGYLYNFRRLGRVFAYQSGFDYDGNSAQFKPGLTCHVAAIGWYLERSAQSYDFLAGDSQYKRSLSNAQNTLHWLVMARSIHPRAWLTHARRLKRSGVALLLHPPSRPREPLLLGDDGC